MYLQNTYYFSECEHQNISIMYDAALKVFVMCNQKRVKLFTLFI